MNKPIASARRVRQGAALLFTALAFTLALPAHAQWKWKDASGKVQYSDRPPPQGTPDKDILQRPAGQEMKIVQWQNGKVINTTEAASAPAAASAPTKAEREADAKRKADEQQLAVKRKAEEQRVADQMRSNCASARSNEQLLNSGQRMVQSNGQGENVAMDDERRAAELQRVRAIIASDCK